MWDSGVAYGYGACRWPKRALRPLDVGSNLLAMDGSRDTLEKRSESMDATSDAMFFPIFLISSIAQRRELHVNKEEKNDVVTQDTKQKEKKKKGGRRDCHSTKSDKRSKCRGEEGQVCLMSCLSAKNGS
jgi:hypothetical protein